MKIKFILIISFYLSSFLIAQYSGGSGAGYSAGSSNAVSLSAFLQGPYSGGTMTTALNTNIPLTQPYNVSPWDYTGTESVASGFFAIHTNIVDWVLVELRNGTANSTTVQKRACFILNNGNIVDLDGTSPVNFDKTNGNSYYVVIRHRNHLAIMSANALTLSSSLAGVYLTGGISNYNFSSAQTQAYGTNPMSDAGGGVWAMIVGDANEDGNITTIDYNLWLPDNNSAASGYLATDMNLDGNVTTADYNLWLPNNNAARSSQVP